MTIRDDRAAAIRRRLRDLGDDHARAMPLLLDDLDAIDDKHGPADSVIAVKPSDDAPSDAAVKAWIEANPDWFSAWTRKQARINGAPPPFATAGTKPAPRRRART